MLLCICNIYIVDKPRAPRNIKVAKTGMPIQLATIRWNFNYGDWNYGIPKTYLIHCKYSFESNYSLASNKTHQPFIFGIALLATPYSNRSCYLTAINNFGMGKASVRFAVINDHEIGNLKMNSEDMKKFANPNYCLNRFGVKMIVYIVHI